MATSAHRIRLNRASLSLLLVGFAVVVSGCATSRRAIPADLISDAHLGDMRNVRTEYLRYHPDIRESLLASSECGFLALSGGGANGAFGAGVLCGWSETGTRPQFQIVTGVSTGALIAPFAFLGPHYDDQLKEAYTTVESRHILRFRGPIGIVRLFFRESYVDTKPLEELIERMFTERELAAIAEQHVAGRRLYVGTTNLDSHRFVIWDMGAIANSGHPDAIEIFRKVLLASAAIPGAFPPVYFNVEVEGQTYDEMHVDGGVIAGVFGYGPLLFQTAEGSDVVPDKPCGIYVIMNGKLHFEYKQTDPRFMTIVDRSVSTLMQRKSWSDLSEIHSQAERDEVDFRYIAIPQSYALSKKRGFDKEEMNKLFELGFVAGTSGPVWDESIRIGP